MTTYGPSTESAIDRVVDALDRFGAEAIVALAGVPGTGKSFIASIAAQRFANEPLLVREIQFHQSFTYEEFIEGMRFDDAGTVKVLPGVFLDLNGLAADDPDHRYVLLIEELTRANLPSVLGELLTFLEYRYRPFYTMYSRKPVLVARNLSILATYNPMDRSAIEVDAALLRRLRVLTFPPSEEQLSEMLTANGLSANVIERIARIFSACQKAFGDEYELGMPFGHGLFNGVKQEADLFDLWNQRIRLILKRPYLDPHPFAEVIRKNYPWTDAAFRVQGAAIGATTGKVAGPAASIGSEQPTSAPTPAAEGPTEDGDTPSAAPADASGEGAGSAASGEPPSSD